MYNHVNQVVSANSLSVLAVQVRYTDIWGTERNLTYLLSRYLVQDFSVEVECWLLGHSSSSVRT